MRQLIRICMLMVMMLVVVACGTSGAPATTESHSMDHDMSAMAPSDAPYDLLFLDSMVAHHQGAIDMARDALDKAEHAELKAFAQNVIMQQDGEITQMQTWRAKWYPDAAATNGLGMHMGDMQIGTDDSTSYDIRWIDAMISHHLGAVDMAKDALKKSQNPDIINLCNAIIQAQTEEISQLQRWREQW